jgi:hypothetical protein
MKSATLNIITEAVDTRFGFLTDEDVTAILADADYATRSLPCLIRCYEGRFVVALADVPAKVAECEREGFTLRDVAFTADTCRRLREHG